MNLFDMLANAQNGQGMDALARQFNLSQQQTQAAVEALLPAFSQGLKRNVADPYGFGAFLTAIANGHHAQYFDNAQTAFSPQGMAEGNGILGHLFGSKDLSRAVAAQAAQATGISQQALQQMLPAIAAMIMGGLFKQTSGQFNPGQFGQTQQAAGFGGSGNPLQEIIEQMMRQGGMGGGQTQQRQQPQAQPQGQPADPFDNPFGKILKDMFGGAVPGMPSGSPGMPSGSPGMPSGSPGMPSGSPGMPGGQAQPQQPRQRQPEPQAQNPSQNPWGDNPLGKIFEEMLKGAQQGGQAQRAPQAEPEETPRQRQRQGQQPGQQQGGRQKNPYDDLFGEMFETGRKQRDEYEKNMGSIFDQFTKGMDRYR